MKILKLNLVFEEPKCLFVRILWALIWLLQNIIILHYRLIQVHYTYLHVAMTWIGEL